jgi:hypothetical protein
MKKIHKAADEVKEVTEQAAEHVASQVASQAAKQEATTPRVTEPTASAKAVSTKVASTEVASTEVASAAQSGEPATKPKGKAYGQTGPKSTQSSTASQAVACLTRSGPASCSLSVCEASTWRRTSPPP